MNRYLSDVGIRKAVHHAKENQCFICYGNRYFTPKEFEDYAKGLDIDGDELRFVSPNSIVTNGKLKLYDLMKKQIEFEKRVEDYLTGKIQ